MLRIFSAYGRAARMRSCALRIFDAATISIALVIFLVFSTTLDLAADFLAGCHGCSLLLVPSARVRRTTS